MRRLKAGVFTEYAIRSKKVIHYTPKQFPLPLPASATFKFYPNPVDHVLIVRSESALDVVIADATGRIRITQSRVQGLHAINVSSLEKGIYLIRFINKHTNLVYSGEACQKLGENTPLFLKRFYCAYRTSPLLLHRFFIGYWILKTGLNFYSDPFFILYEC